MNMSKIKSMLIQHEFYVQLNIEQIGTCFPIDINMQRHSDEFMGVTFGEHLQFFVCSVQTVKLIWLEIVFANEYILYWIMSNKTALINTLYAINKFDFVAFNLLVSMCSCDAVFPHIHSQNECEIVCTHESKLPWWLRSMLSTSTPNIMHHR